MNAYKSPLSIYIVWHPANPDGLAFGEAMYKTFCRDTADPLNRSIGIPVYFRYAPAEGKDLPPGIDTNESDRNAIVLLIDNKMYADAGWKPFVLQLLAKENDKDTRVFPVALSQYAFALDEQKLNAKQFIDLHALTGPKPEATLALRIKALKSSLLHDLSRFLYKMARLSDAGDAQPEPPVKLFVSHAKADGLNTAMNFRDYVNSKLKLKTFFDANDIADALNFEQQINQHLENSAIVVFLSDMYSTREWCRIEVIVAKRNKSPLVVVNTLENGEKRSFPYLGNVPTIRNYHEDFEEIVDLTLYQVLNNLFLKGKLRRDAILYELPARYEVICFGNPPELFNYIDIKKAKEQCAGKNEVLVLYPDPPLGTEELNVLKELDEEIIYITPSLIYHVS